MNDYSQVTVTVSPCSEDVTDVLAALLSERGYESFVPSDTGMVAYVPCQLFDKALLDEAIAEMPFTDVDIRYEVEDIEGRDWNAEWEKHYFRPIVIDDLCVIHSSFHTDVPQARYDIVIDPKMAFGTGHHSTTCLMLRAILETDLKGRSVLDMGCGTALLAILARMRGADSVTAVDIDPFAYENALENIRLNEVSDIEVRLGGCEAFREGDSFDFVFANINRNILLADMACYAAHMAPGAKLFMSGFYTDDIDILLETARTCGLRFLCSAEDNRWAMVACVKE